MNHTYMKIAAGLAASLMVLTGCTKERPFKPVPKTDFGTKQVSKSVITIGPGADAEYIYVPSALESTRKASAARPHWMSDGKRVKFQFTENSLRVIEPEKDGRFTENPTNANAVLTIPIEHVDYKCVEDDFGDCTRREEENNEIAWDKRGYFKLKPEDLEAQQVTFMPVDIMNWITGGACFKENGSELVDAQWTETGINIVLEKTYTGSPYCVNWTEIDSFSDFTFTVRYQHSFKKLNQIADPNYKPVQYTRQDENNFGFFNTEKDLLDIDNNDLVQSRTWMFDRWNPNKKVVYYLTENFNKPEYKKIKEATYKAFESINNGLAKAGTNMRLELREPVKGMSPADINNNMIVMVEDPLSAGLIGYGPHVSNPLTGEILHARTVMYIGTMKKYIRYDYDHIIEEKLAAKAANTQLTMSPAALSNRRTLVMPMTHLAGPANHVVPNSVQGFRVPPDLVNRELDIDKLAELTLYPKDNQFFAKDLKERIIALSKHCEYPAELFNFEDAIGAGIDEVIEEVGMRPWDSLTEAEKAKVLDVLLPYVWVPTFIHEVGHNLGLRHNFAGSEDLENFYTQEELKDMGVNRPFRYSSVMDYAYRVNNELRTLGKYDIAALKYGYAERVELADGTEVSLDEYRANPAAELKSYAYCTDEHADVNPNCNRFDEGTNLAEIAQHYVRAYEKRYTRANYRNNRRRFSLLRDFSQMAALDDTFFNMRLMFERYETIKNVFSLPDDAPEWNSIPFLKELKDATVTAGHFYLNVLKTPDLMCAVSLASKPNEIIAVVPIRVLSKRAIGCFDTNEIRLNPQYVIVAEGGKNFQSRKDPANPNPYADEIDVRGIWIDKMLATQYLFARHLGSTLFDNYTENMIHMPELQAPILETLEQLVTDDVVGPVTFRTKDGFKVDFNVGYRLFDVNDADNSHKIPPLLDDNVRRALDLPDSTVLFHTHFVNSMLNLVEDQTHLGMTEAMLTPYRVYPNLPHDGRESEYRAIQIGDRRYFARPSAAVIMALMDGLEISGLLSRLSQQQLEKVLAATDDTGLSAIEKAARALGKETIEKYLNGGFQAPAYYATMIKSLAARDFR